MATIREVKQSVQEDLLKLRGVTGVGIGPKFSQGKRTGELAIVVFVERKVPRAELAADDVIPQSVQGFPTDVVGAGRTRLTEDRPYVEVRKFRKKQGGIHGGIRLAYNSSEFEKPPWGTLGCMAIRDVPQGREILALTCAHVVNDIIADGSTPFRTQAEKLGREIGQPTPSDPDLSPCCADIIGKVDRARFDLHVDAAVVRLNAGLPWAADIEGIGAVSATRVVTEADLQAGEVIVRKRGTRTLLTRGVVRAIHQAGATTTHEGVTIRLYDGQIAVAPIPPFKAFIMAGDSGSAVVDASNRVVGINHSEVATARLQSNGEFFIISAFGISSPITDVELALDVSVATTTTAGDVRTVPDIQASSAAPVAEDARPRALQPAYLTPLYRARDELDAIPAGKQWLDVLRRHEEQARQLIRSEPRVAAVWKTREGPDLARAFMMSVYRPRAPIFGGRSRSKVASSIADILGVLRRYADDVMRRDIDLVAPALLRWSAMSYVEVLRDLATHQPYGAGNEPLPAEE
jgi:uncharacterized protein YwbE